MTTTSFRRPTLSYLPGISRGPGCFLEMGRPDAPPLLFLHGFAGDLLTWHYCLVPFVSRFRVIAIDLPGHGRSTPDVGQGRLDEMVAWLAEAMDSLGTTDAHLVGHSMGGKIALGMALAHPRRVRSLFLAAPAGLGGYFDIGFLHDLLGLKDQEAAERMALRLIGAKAAETLVSPLATSLLSVARDPSRRNVLLRLLDNAAICEAISTDGIAWQRIACPMHFVWGTDDHVIPEPAPELLPPRMDVTRLEGIGHLPHIEAQGQLVSLLDTFLRTDCDHA